MSLVWIKVDRENKTHSAYSDGQQAVGTMIGNNDCCKIDSLKIGSISVLIGLTGNAYVADYLKKQLSIKLATNVNLYNIENNNICRELSELLETIAKEYKEKYNRPIESVELIMSINGTLFKIWNLDDDDPRWICIKSNENFICAGAPDSEAKALLYYDENIDPQVLLNIIRKVCNVINTYLFKIENVKY